MNWKYLILVQENGIPVPVLFSGLFKHAEMAAKLALPVLGAGHVRFVPSGEMILVQTYGEAGSLVPIVLPQDADETIICEDSRRFRDDGSGGPVDAPRFVPDKAPWVGLYRPVATLLPNKGT